MTRFELDFEPHSYGFRPKKNLQQAVLQSLAYINDGYQDIVDIDLKGFLHCQSIEQKVAFVDPQTSSP